MIPQRGGLPHSDIHGSTPARGSPWLFAACHVLHRLLVPRHPPNALLMLESTEPSFRKVQTIMYRNHPHQDLSQCEGTRTTMLELSLHTTNHWPSQPTIRQNASEHMCRRSLGCIPPGVATQPDLGRSDFAIPQPSLRQRGAVGTRSHGSPTNGAPRDAPEPDSQFERTDASQPFHPGRSRHHQPTPKPLQSEVILLSAEYQSSLRRAKHQTAQGGDGMEVNGFEPMTPCLQSRCSPS